MKLFRHNLSQKTIMDILSRITLENVAKYYWVLKNKQIKILIVDDTIFNIMGLKSTLLQIPQVARIDYATSGLQSLSMLNEMVEK